MEGQEEWSPRVEGDGAEVPQPGAGNWRQNQPGSARAPLGFLLHRKQVRILSRWRSHGELMVRVAPNRDMSLNLTAS